LAITGRCPRGRRKKLQPGISAGTGPHPAGARLGAADLIYAIWPARESVLSFGFCLFIR